ncbi:unnamed protein product [Coregonus sp. 'balchen']|nr:unnamed protein product [Coregonus sp. 'balchen']
MCVAMMGVVLLFLLALWPGGKVDAIDGQVLANVVQELRRFGLEGHQYAMAVRLTQQQCTGNVINFNIGVQPQEVQQILMTGNVYIGNRLIAATPNTYHAEYRLLWHDGTNPSRMQTLLRAANRNECIVFFSTYSPCLERCNVLGGATSILPFMDVFRAWNDNQKAFVFSSVWNPTISHSLMIKPTKTQVFDSFMRINEFINLFRCVTYKDPKTLKEIKSCHHCNNENREDCLYGYN